MEVSKKKFYQETEISKFFLSSLKNKFWPTHLVHPKNLYLPKNRIFYTKIFFKTVWKNQSSGTLTEPV